jgi:hypothetical protein
LDDLKEARRYWKFRMALFGELSLDEVMDLSQDRQVLESKISLLSRGAGGAPTESSM